MNETVPSFTCANPRRDVHLGDSYFLSGFSLSMRIGLYVSGKKIMATRTTLVEKIAEIHIVHLQPRELWTMKVPAIGPKTGPINPVETKQSIAIPRLTGDPQRSVSAPPVTAIEEEPNAPLKNLQIRIVCIFLASAIGMQKRAKKASPISNGNLRPIFSDNGPHTNGPQAKP
jgi:hypothetical protein